MIEGGEMEIYEMKVDWEKEEGNKEKKEILKDIRKEKGMKMMEKD